MGRSDWVTVRRAAELAETPIRTMRRHVVALHAEHGTILRHPSGRPLRRRPGTVRKYLVDLQALKSAVEQHPDLREVELDYITRKVRDLEQKVNALRNSHNALKRQVLSAQ